MSIREVRKKSGEVVEVVSLGPKCRRMYTWLVEALIEPHGWVAVYAPTTLKRREARRHAKRLRRVGWPKVRAAPYVPARLFDELAR